MRVELRIEQDEHEYAVGIECDRAISAITVMDTAREAMSRLLVAADRATSGTSTAR